MGWNGNNTSSTESANTRAKDGSSKTSKIKLSHGLVAGLIVLTGASVYLLVPKHNGINKTPTINIGTVTPGRPKIPTVATKKPDPIIVKSESVVQDPNKRFENGVEVVSSSVYTNTSGAVIEKLVLADGKKMSKIHPPKPVFENAAEQVIAMAISTKPGQSMPPLPNLDNSLEKDFLDSLLTPTRINEEDSDEVKQLKARVLETKAYLVDEIKNGGSLLQALRDHQAAMENNADAHLLAIQEAQKIRAEYGDEEADTFISQINESFKARGIAEIEKPQRGETGRRNK